MGAPMGNRNAAGGRGGATNKMRAALKKTKSREIMSRLSGRKQRVTKMQLATKGAGTHKTPSYAGMSWRASAARFKKK